MVEKIEGPGFGQDFRHGLFDFFPILTLIGTAALSATGPKPRRKFEKSAFQAI
jgi:hypothetical protein